MMKTKIRHVLVPVLAALLVSGCSFQPMYGAQNSAVVSALAFNYGKPNSRIEQIIYQRLGLSFPSVASAPTLRVSTAVVSDKPMRSEGTFAIMDVAITATAIISRDGKELGRVVRRSSTSYPVNTPQVLARNEAATAAQEQVADAVAESLRLAILSMAGTLQ